MHSEDHLEQTPSLRKTGRALYNYTLSITVPYSRSVRLYIASLDIWVIWKQVLRCERNRRRWETSIMTTVCAFSYEEVYCVRFLFVLVCSTILGIAVKHDKELVVVATACSCDVVIIKDGRMTPSVFFATYEKGYPERYQISTYIEILLRRGEVFIPTFPAPKKCLYTLIWRWRSRRSIYTHPYLHGVINRRRAHPLQTRYCSIISLCCKICMDPTCSSTGSKLSLLFSLASHLLDAV